MKSTEGSSFDEKAAVKEWVLFYREDAGWGYGDMYIEGARWQHAQDAAKNYELERKIVELQGLIETTPEKGGFSIVKGPGESPAEDLLIEFNARGEKIAKLEAEIQGRKESYFSLDDINTNLNDKNILLRSIISKAQSALNYYASGDHIRSFESEQVVILELCEVEPETRKASKALTEIEAELGKLG